MHLGNQLFLKGNFGYFRKGREIFRLAMLRLHVILLQRDIAVRCRLPLPGRFLPELGRSFGSGLFSL